MNAPDTAILEELRELFAFAKRHQRLLVLTGAGCSTEAGIPDYRDAQGAWKRSEPMRYQVFVADALARLERAGRIALLVTQNVDGLHSTAGSTNVVDLHGHIGTVCCLACGARSPRQTLQDELVKRNPQWLALQARSAPDGDADLEVLDFAPFDVPACTQCGGMLKPDVVFFGENVPRERVAAVRAALSQADALLVAGSSLMVYSGYRFVEEAVAAGKPVAVVNIGRTRADAVLTLKLELEVGSALEELARWLEAA